MKSKIFCILIIFSINILYINVANAGCNPLYPSTCVSNKTKNKVKATKKNLKGKYDATVRNTSEKLKATGKNLKGKYDATIRNSKAKLAATRRNAKKKFIATKKNISNKFNASIKNIDQKASTIRHNYSAKVKDIQNKSQASINNIQNQRTNTINAIRQGAQYESQKAVQKIQASSRKLDDFRRNNPVNQQALSSAFDAAQKSVSRKAKKFGTKFSSENIKKGTRNTLDHVESSAAGKEMHRWGKRVSTEQISKGYNNTLDHIESSTAGKELHQWGKRVSTEQITKGYNNTLDHIESSAAGKELHRWGKRVSTENISKGYNNTLDHVESSSLAKGLHNAGKRVSVENISKGTANTVDYWESSPVGKTLHETGKRVSVENISKGITHAGEYVDEKSTAASKKGKKILSNPEAAVRGEIKRNVDKLKKSPLYKYFQERALSLFMESPDIIDVQHPTYPPKIGSRPVYYMNGMYTDRGFAIIQAQNLSKQLRRPVKLVLNKSVVDGNTGSPAGDDFSESVYDRFWPTTLGGGGTLPTIANPVGATVPFTQLNLATRWLTHILYHENGPITIVSHSQACIITRNAILTTMLLGKENKMKNSVAWIAAGNPLHDNEVELSMPSVYISIHREDDFVANWIGMRDGDQGDTFRAWKNGWNPDTGDGALSKHLPTKNYFPHIYNLPGDSRNQDYRLLVRNDDRKYRITGNYVNKRTMPASMTQSPQQGTVSFN